MLVWNLIHISMIELVFVYVKRDARWELFRGFQGLKKGPKLGVK
jgi:hypothetical protein